jgi:DNA-directed RNA polymerase specialized sigma24 family protein
MSPFLSLSDVLFRPDDSLDPVAFEILKRAVGEAVRGWGKPGDDSADLLNDLVLKLLEHRTDDGAEGGPEAVTDEDRLFCSCLAVARNHLIDGHRKAYRLRAEDPVVLDGRAGQERPTRPEQEIDLKLIGHPKSEEVIRLLLHEGLSVSDVAGMMRLTERRVRGLRLLGLRRLHTRYTRDADDHPG